MGLSPQVGVEIQTRRNKVIRETMKVQDIIEGKVKSPLDVSVIPNHMGINLCSVDSLDVVRLPDGQIVTLAINFLPAF